MLEKDSLKSEEVDGLELKSVLAYQIDGDDEQNKMQVKFSS